MADPSLHPGASLLGTQDAPAVASPTKANHGNFVLDLVPSTTAAMSIIKSAVEEQAAVYAQEERQRRDLALDREFASKTSDEVLAYLKRHLKPETYNIVFNELGDGSSNKHGSSSQSTAQQAANTNDQVENNAPESDSLEDCLEGDTLTEDLSITASGAVGERTTSSQNAADKENIADNPPSTCTVHNPHAATKIDSIIETASTPKSAVAGTISQNNLASIAATINKVDSMIETASTAKPASIETISPNNLASDAATVNKVDSMIETASTPKPASAETISSNNLAPDAATASYSSITTPSSTYTGPAFGAPSFGICPSARVGGRATDHFATKGAFGFGVGTGGQNIIDGENAPSEFGTLGQSSTTSTGDFSTGGRKRGRHDDDDADTEDSRRKPESDKVGAEVSVEAKPDPTTRADSGSSSVFEHSSDAAVSEKLEREYRRKKLYEIPPYTDTLPKISLPHTTTITRQAPVFGAPSALNAANPNATTSTPTTFPPTTTSTIANGILTATAKSPAANAPSAEAPETGISKMAPLFGRRPEMIEEARLANQARLAQGARRTEELGQTANTTSSATSNTPFAGSAPENHTSGIGGLFSPYVPLIFTPTPLDDDEL